MEIKLKEAAYSTPDPERALNNLSSFLAENPAKKDEFEVNLRSVAMLFSCSQFLANYCVLHPDLLFSSLNSLDLARDKESYGHDLRERLNSIGEATRSSMPLFMSEVRRFRMQEILRITLRDILSKADLVEVMFELSALADVIIDNSLSVVRRSLKEVHGSPDDDAFSVISLGKLGGEELNFSSDVDLMFVYGTGAGETSGVMNAKGIVKNRISNHEYYRKVSEELSRFLSLNTDTGYVYRVDLRLRPEGQRGPIAQELRGYEMYYESWGRAWERAMLIRARPVAGEPGLGNGFIEMIRPFVYRKYLDFSSIDEISKLKTRIDSTFKKGDIKRGYGGIREIEFFAQALQLIYGGKEPLLRERSILVTLHRLLQKALIGHEDYSVLSENYRHFRTLEHRLQQLNDLQTHTVPSGEGELNGLGRKMGFCDGRAFLTDLEGRRSSVRRIYASLFAEKQAEPSTGMTFFSEELSDPELREYLSNAGLRDADSATRMIKALKDSMVTFQTLKGRRLLGEIIPAFVDCALKSSSPDKALNQLQSFAVLLSTNESYLEVFGKNEELIRMLTYVFAQSDYLTKMILKRPKYLEMMGWEEKLKKGLGDLLRDISNEVAEEHSLNDAIRLVKQMEEIRLGLLFLRKRTSVEAIVRGLSKTAEAILKACMEVISDTEIAVIGLGKLGGREISFNSDLDIIFVSPGEVEHSDTKAAEKILMMLIAYTREGNAYRVDTRLRPEGSKGPLVSSVDSLGKYYSKAAFWELQALLKARPVAGNIRTGLAFMDMAKGILKDRGTGVSASDILQMRERILRELSREADGFDIKLGPGGLEEIEFVVQYLQLKNCHKNEEVLVQGTLKAIRRLEQADILEKADAAFLTDAYLFYRTVESLLRLRGEKIIKREQAILESAAEFSGEETVDKFVVTLGKRRTTTRDIFGKYLSRS